LSVGFGPSDCQWSQGSKREIADSAAPDAAEIEDCFKSFSISDTFGRADAGNANGVGAGGVGRSPGPNCPVIDAIRALADGDSLGCAVIEGVLDGIRMFHYWNNILKLIFKIASQRTENPVPCLKHKNKRKQGFLLTYIAAPCNLDLSLQ
jgi:hypothetical protein